MSTMRKLRISDELEVPAELITEATAILGMRGRGKTNTAVVIVEEMVETGLPIVVFDTVGVWWGLRSSADGKAAGLPVVVFGGDHGDVKLEAEAGKVIADVIIEQRISCVIDTSHLSKAATRRFALDFVTQMYHRNRSPLHIVFDEADELAPQRTAQGDPNSARLLGAMEDLVRRGRARGLGVTLVTQRPAVLNKDVLTQVEVLIALGMTGPRDVAAIDEWVSLHASQEDAKELHRTLASLPTGTAWVWSPSWLNILQKTKIRRRRTFDSSATPKLGEIKLEPKVLAEIDLTKLGTQIAETVEKQKADDPRTLRRELAERNLRIANLEAQVAERPAAEPTTVEVPVVTEEQITALDRLSGILGELLDPLAEMREKVGEKILEVEDSIAKLSGAWFEDAHDGYPPPTPGAFVPSSSLPAAPRPAPSIPAVRQDTPPPEGLTKQQAALLGVLAQFPSLSKKQLAMRSGYSWKSSAFSPAITGLRVAGFITGEGTLSITDAGRTAVGSIESVPTGRALVDHWVSRLKPMEGRMLLALAQVWPNSLTHTELAAATGYSVTSSAFSPAVNALKSFDLAEGTKDALAASDNIGEAARS